MNRRIALTAAVVVTLGSWLLPAATASAQRVAWNLSLGGPGYALNVGAPGYWGGPVGYRGFGQPGPWRPWYRPAFAPFVPAPVVYAVAPVPVAVAWLPPVAYPALYRVAPVRVLPRYAPRRVVVAAPIMLPPRHRHH